MNGLLCAIHWVEYVRGTRPLLSGVVNSIPFGLFLLVSLVEHSSKKLR